MPVLCPQARKYLDFLAAHPHMKRTEVEAAIGSGTASAERWVRTYGDEFRGEEESIRARFKIGEAKRKEAGRALAAGKPMPTGAPAVLETDELDPRLARFLELFAETRNRSKAIEGLKAGGLTLEWEDVEAAIQGDKAFRARFMAIFERVIVAVEDKVIEKGLEGKLQGALAVLRAHRPQKYGNRMRVTFDGAIQLSAADHSAVEEAKGGALKKFRLRAAKSAADLPGGVAPEDVVDGEVLRETAMAGEGVN